MYKITLTEEDYLNFQLYTASRSKRLKNRTTLSRILVTFIFLSLGFLFYRRDDTVLAYYFWVAAGIALFFFPHYARWRYRRHYRKHVADHYKNMINVPCQVEFAGGYIVSKDESGEIKFLMADIEQVFETAGNLFVKTKKGHALIIPKRMTDYEGFVREFAEQTKDTGLVWQKALSWKW